MHQLRHKVLGFIWHSTIISYLFVKVLAPLDPRKYIEMGDGGRSAIYPSFVGFPRGYEPNT